MLGVQIQQFQNLHNAEIRNGEYCCCDDPLCENDIMALENSCSPSCETYFVASLQNCASNTQCTINQTFNLEDDSISGLSSVIFHTHFGQPGLDAEVRTKQSFSLPFVAQTWNGYVVTSRVVSFMWLTGFKIILLHKLAVCMDKLKLMYYSWMTISMCTTLAAAICSGRGIPVSWLLGSGKCHFS